MCVSSIYAEILFIKLNKVSKPSAPFSSRRQCVLRSPATLIQFIFLRYVWGKVGRVYKIRKLPFQGMREENTDSK